MSSRRIGTATFARSFDATWRARADVVDCLEKHRSGVHRDQPFRL
jgi:hypothetical protein